MMRISGVFESIYHQSVTAEPFSVAYHRRIGLLLLGITLGLSLAATPGASAMTDDSCKLGVEAIEQGQVTGALQHFLDAARVHPQDARVANALGNAWFALNNPLKARKEYGRALRFALNACPPGAQGFALDEAHDEQKHKTKLTQRTKQKRGSKKGIFLKSFDT
ncbi:MAG: tetratricopeptide repeat protein [Terriglobia bacterium]